MFETGRVFIAVKESVGNREWGFRVYGPGVRVFVCFNSISPFSRFQSPRSVLSVPCGRWRSPGRRPLHTEAHTEARLGGRAVGGTRSRIAHTHAHTLASI